MRPQCGSALLTCGGNLLTGLSLPHSSAVYSGLESQGGGWDVRAGKRLPISPGLATQAAYACPLHLALYSTFCCRNAPASLPSTQCPDIPNCVGYASDAGECVCGGCVRGYALMTATNTCAPCEANCEECTGAGPAPDTCIKCAPNYRVNAGDCEQW